MKNILNKFSKIAVLGSFIINQVHAVLPEELETQLGRGGVTQLVLNNASPEDFNSILGYLPSNPLETMEIHNSTLSDPPHIAVFEGLGGSRTFRSLTFVNSIINEATAACVLTLCNGPARPLKDLRLINSTVDKDGTNYNETGFRGETEAIESLQQVKEARKRAAARILGIARGEAVGPEEPLPAQVFGYPAVLEGGVSLESITIEGSDFMFPMEYWNACSTLRALTLRNYGNSGLENNYMYVLHKVNFPAVIDLELTGTSSVCFTKFPAVERAVLSVNVAHPLFMSDDIPLIQDLSLVEYDLNEETQFQMPTAMVSVMHSALDHQLQRLTLPVNADFEVWRDLIEAIKDPTKQPYIGQTLDMTRFEVRPIEDGLLWSGMWLELEPEPNDSYWQWKDYYKLTKADLLLEAAGLMLRGATPRMTPFEFWGKLGSEATVSLAIKLVWEKLNPGKRFNYLQEFDAKEHAGLSVLSVVWNHVNLMNRRSSRVVEVTGDAAEASGSGIRS